MKLVDVSARNLKEFAIIQRKVTAFVRKNSGKMCNMGRLEFSTNGGLYYIELENDGLLGLDHLQDFVTKSQTAALVKVDEYKGTYDWSSDTYARPVSIVTFKF